MPGRGINTQTNGKKHLQCIHSYRQSLHRAAANPHWFPRAKHSRTKPVVCGWQRFSSRGLGPCLIFRQSPQSLCFVRCLRMEKSSMQIAAKPLLCVPLTLCKTLPCRGCLCSLGSAGLSACPGQTPSGFLLSVPAVSFDWGIRYKQFFSFSGNVVVFLQVFLLHWMNFFFL